MVDIPMGIVFIQAVVAAAFIREDNSIVSTELLNVCTEGISLGIGHDKRSSSANTLRHSEDSGFRLQ